MSYIKSHRFKLLLFLIIILFIWQASRFIPSLQSSKTVNVPRETTSSEIVPVLVTVLYEALCPDSKNFILRQLKPSVEKAPKLFNVNLIPYGKAQTEESGSGSLSFTCQHGPTECLANKIHACAVSKIPYSVLQIQYISCMIDDNMVPELIGEKCAKELGVNWNSILECSNSEKGNILLKDYGILTNKLTPKIKFIPTVLLNNNLGSQPAILKDLFGQVCLLYKELPSECFSTI